MTRNKRRFPGGRGILALAATGALALAAGCGDDGESASNPFCEDFTEFDAKWEGDASLEELQAGEMDEATLRGIISDLRNLDPPDEIASEWPQFVDALETIGSSETPEEAAASVQDPAVAGAIQAVETYVDEQCTDAS